ncbi:TonB-dependent receptor domain-containing protein [Sphingomonas sp. MMS24-JH45]
MGATWFDITKRGILTNDPTDPGFNARVGRLTSRGIEVDASARIDGRWQLVANYAWTHARNDATFATDRVLNVPEHAGTLFALGRFLDDAGRGPSVSAGVAMLGDLAGAIDASGLAPPAMSRRRRRPNRRCASKPATTVRCPLRSSLQSRPASTRGAAHWRASLRIGG